jgi:hypothetical protein
MMHGFVEAEQHVAGVDLAELEPLTILLVWTWHSVYRIVVVEGHEVLVQGGPFFSDLTRAHLDGASTGGRALKAGWIAVGHLMALRINGQVILTSPVVAVATQGCGMPAVH